ncbi:MAG: hypothetical protein HYW45_02455 [Candidatus Daviesbacteria bacterium]|nr:MAG: hypothetical protein HYW45_02455 [Candidatus Daviesbacteria bacterium]
MTFRPDLERNLLPSIVTRPARGVRGLELPPPGKTIQDMEPIPPKKGLEKGKLAWSAAAGILIGVNLAPKVQEYVDNPDSFNPQAVMRDITSFPGAAWNKVVEISQVFNWFQKQEVVVPDTFDPTAKKGVIGKNNSVDIPISELKTEINNGTAQVPLIIRLPDGYTDQINYELLNAFGVKREGQPVNNQLKLSNLPVGTEIISPWTGKINQGAEFPRFNDGSVEMLQAKIVAKDENGNKFTVTLSTGRVKVPKEIPHSNGLPVLENDLVLATELKKGDVLAVIASPTNSKWFDGQVAITLGIGGGANIQIQTQDGKAINPR